MYQVRNLKSGCSPYPQYAKMKDRIFQIMKQEGLNQKEFAATTGISPATLSSIFNGRTSPTLNHAEALHRRFPKLNMSWLLFGEGDMYQSEKRAENSGSSDSTDLSGGLFPGLEMGDGTSSAAGSDPADLSFDLAGGTPRVPVIREVVKYVDKPQRVITEIRIFFDDGTFQTFPGR